MAGWVSGLFSAKTKLPLIEWRPGREEGEPVEGFPYPDHRPHGQGTTSEQRKHSLTWPMCCWEWQFGGKHTVDICGSSRAGWRHKTKRRKEGDKPSSASSCIQQKCKSTNIRVENGFLVANNYVLIRAKGKRSCWGIMGTEVHTSFIFCLGRICKTFKPEKFIESVLWEAVEQSGDETRISGWRFQSYLG